MDTCHRCGAQRGEPCRDRAANEVSPHRGRLVWGAAPIHNRSDFRQWLGWATKHLPGEHSAMAAVSASVLASEGGKVTVRAVRERLRAQGRDMATLTKEER